MTFFSSNELTGGHGVSPVSRPKVAIETKDFTRAFLVYIKMTTDLTKPQSPVNFLRIRQFYHDYGTHGIDDYETLIAKALLIGRKTDKDLSDDLGSDIDNVPGFGDKYIDVQPPSKREPFPYIFAKYFDEVNFGWEPCHVIFLIDNPYFEFVAPGDPDNPDTLNQPIVFRKNKAIETDSGKWDISESYEENHSFFNLKRISGDGYSALVMENHMKVGTQQTPIGKQPTTGDPKDWPVWRYCMDICVRVPLAKRKTLAERGGQEAVFAEEAKHLTIVFDPPQNNGNGNGP